MEKVSREKALQKNPLLQNTFAGAHRIRLVSAIFPTE